MNTSTAHILQCNQSEPLADASHASGRIVDLMTPDCSVTGHRSSHRVVLCLSDWSGRSGGMEAYIRMLSRSLPVAYSLRTQGNISWT